MKILNFVFFVEFGGRNAYVCDYVCMQVLCVYLSVGISDYGCEWEYVISLFSLLKSSDNSTSPLYECYQTLLAPYLTAYFLHVDLCSKCWISKSV